jgi:Xaa-Pro aminopeptidase
VEDQSVIERVGPSYAGDGIEAARLATWQAVRDISAVIQPGMRQRDAIDEARALLVARGISPGWHKVFVKFGANTAMNYWQDTDMDVVLRASDIFFVDIGPIVNGIEGDAGDTFVIGDDADFRRIAADVRDVWRETCDHWRAGGASGADLYSYASQSAQRRGWDLDTDVAGHRLSDFPHKAYHPGPLGDVDFPPTSQRWVLEIQILHPDRTYGAFFEDLLEA